jgi:restriction endonuclease Mrr
MAVPDFQTLMLPLLKLASDGQQHTLAEAIEWLAKSFSFLTTTEHNFSEAGRRGCTTASAGQPPTSRRRACSRPLRGPEWPATDRNVLEFINGHVFDPTDFVIRTDGVCRFETGNGRCMVGLAGRS